MPAARWPSGADAGMAMLATHLSAATATLVWMAIEWITFGKPSLVGAVTGTIAGLATITPAAGYVGPLGAVLLGAAASIVCFMAVHAGQAGHGGGRCAGRAGRAWRGRRAGHLAAAFLARLGAGGAALHHPVARSSWCRRKAWWRLRSWSAVATFVITKLAGLAGGPAGGPRT